MGHREFYEHLKTTQDNTVFSLEDIYFFLPRKQWNKLLNKFTELNIETRKSFTKEELMNAIKR